MNFTRYDEHDQDGRSMPMVYSSTCGQWASAVPTFKIDFWLTYCYSLSEVGSYVWSHLSNLNETPWEVSFFILTFDNSSYSLSLKLGRTFGLISPIWMRPPIPRSSPSRSGFRTAEFSPASARSTPASSLAMLSSHGTMVRRWTLFRAKFHKAVWQKILLEKFISLAKI